MESSQVVEALWAAHKARATGALTVHAGGRESRLWLRAGDLVGAQLGFGFQGSVQTLMQAGKLTAEQLDALWSERAEGGADRVDTEAPGMLELKVLAQVRRLSELAETASFEAGDV